MDSHRVVLLTEAFFAGWLDFEPKTPFDGLRESIVLRYTEKKLLEKLYEVITVSESSIAAGIKMTPQVLEHIATQRDTYVETLLPFMIKKDKIDSASKNMPDVSDTAGWKKFLTASKKKLLNK